MLFSRTADALHSIFLSQVRFVRLRVSSICLIIRFDASSESPRTIAVRIPLCALCAESSRPTMPKSNRKNKAQQLYFRDMLANMTRIANGFPVNSIADAALFKATNTDACSVFDPFNQLTKHSRVNPTTDLSPAKQFLRGPVFVLFALKRNNKGRNNKGHAQHFTSQSRCSLVISSFMCFAHFGVAHEIVC